MEREKHQLSEFLQEVTADNRLPTVSEAKLNKLGGVAEATEVTAPEPNGDNSCGNPNFEEADCKVLDCAGNGDSGRQQEHFDFRRHIMESKSAVISTKSKWTSEIYNLVANIVPALVILANSLAVGLSQDHDPDTVGWLILETFFVIFYIGELTVNMKLSGIRTFFALNHVWNWFDFCCAVAGSVDCVTTWGYKLTFSERSNKFSQFLLIKVLRLARLVRLVRLARHKIFAELRLMIMGLAAGSRTLFWSYVLLMTIVYVLGVACSLLLDSDKPEFSGLDASMFTVFRCITGDCSAESGVPLSEVMRQDVGSLFSFVYVVVIVIVSIGVFNLITAIFIDTVTSSQNQRKMKLLSDNTMKFEADLKMHLCRLLEVDGWMAVAKAKISNQERIKILNDGLAQHTEDIHYELFSTWLEDRELMDTLEEADVETSFADHLFTSLDATRDGSLNMQELCDGFLKLRGPVCKSDVVGMGLKVDLILNSLELIASKL